MSYIGSHIATVPSDGFQWYLIFLEDSFNTNLKKDIENHFPVLGREAGADVLVVKGFDAAEFRDSVYETPAFFNDKWRDRAKFPSLLVINGPPSQVLCGVGKLDNSKIMIFPLENIYKEQGTLANFFSDLLEALKSNEAMVALETMEKKALTKWWRWLNKYSKMEPGFFGFSIKLNEILKDVMD